MTVATRPLIVNSDRLNRSIMELAEVGQLPNGGVCRIAFSDEDGLARQQVQRWMREAGMSVRIDAAGNIIGRCCVRRRSGLDLGGRDDRVSVGIGVYQCGAGAAGDIGAQ
ncbi:MAG: hypothetical protein ACP5RH_05055 [Leptodesmis sp.]|uniref:hypothetical protein n=1 Tax=Leptodesmis sp. TaxID=3100501 RepID=UPI003D149395